MSKNRKKIDEDLFELLFQLSKNIKDKMNYFSEVGNITIPQFMALSFIKREKSVQMKEIAEHFSIEMPTATSLLNKLAKQSLIVRKTKKTDRRVVRISLNTKGEKLLSFLKKIQEENMKTMLNYLSNQQKEEMLNILQTILNQSNHEK